MVLRREINDSIIIKYDDLNWDKIISNDMYKLCTGNIDQYIVTEDNKLYGVLSSCDIEKYRNQKDNISIETFINRNPVTIIQNRHEKVMAESVFDNSLRLSSIPVIDKNNKLLYFYFKVNQNLLLFHKKNETFSNNFYINVLEKTFYNAKHNFPNYEVKIMTDVYKYDLSLESFNKYVIDKSEVKLLGDRDIVILCFLYDFNCIEIINELIKNKIKYIGCNITGLPLPLTPYFKMDENAYKTLLKEAYYNGNYFDYGDFSNICQIINMTKALDGSYVEIGTYRGDSARLALSYMKEIEVNKEAYFLDTYEGFSYIEADESADSLWARTHEDTSLNLVNDRLKEFDNYHLVKANIITDALPASLTKISVCNIDVDMYEAVQSALFKVKNLMVQGGVIIAEDYGHTPILYGANCAVREFIRDYGNEFYGLYMESGQYIMIKK